MGILCAVLLADVDPGPALYWKWSDGSTAPSRTIDATRAASLDALPRIVVTTRPATPGLRVLLQFRDEAGLHVEDSTRTGSGGRARLSVNPFGRSGDWLTGPADYRLAVGARSAAVRITFAPGSRASRSPGHSPLP